MSNKSTWFEHFSSKIYTY